MKTLVLAEKPSVGREIARVLNCPSGEKTHREGKDYIVTWAMGHLAELADPEAYDERFKTWRLDYLPMLPEKMKLRVIGRTSGQFKAVKALLKRPDVERTVIATDAGREGELVARWILRLAGWKGKTQRLWINSQTDQAIRQGFAALKPAGDYDRLFQAAEARAEADWLVGLNITRALTCRFDARLSAGRVQTPTLAILAARDREIEAFRSEPFWTIRGDFGAYQGLWRGNDGRTRFSDRAKAEALAAGLEGKEAVIEDVKIKERTVPPPLAYDLTELQREANRRLGFSAKKTLQVLQDLYERHKIVSYPRTDSRYIPADVAATLPDRLAALGSTPLGKIAAGTAENLAAGTVIPGKRFVDDAKVGDHHAIIPTEEPVNYEKLDGEEKALWNLVARRFLAVLSPPARFQDMEIITRVEDQRFFTRGSRVIRRGWQDLDAQEEEEREDEDDLPGQNLKDHRPGEIFKAEKILIKEGKTQPPARHTEASLLAAMENPGKNQGSSFGLGTPATRADIIEKLLNNYYAERRGRELVITGQGLALLELAPEELASPELTARWEFRLDRIIRGEETKQAFINDIREYTAKQVSEIRDSQKQYRPRNLSNEACPLCGKRLMKAADKKGRPLLVCPSRSCGYEDEAGSGGTGGPGAGGSAGKTRGGGSTGGRPGRREQAIARSYMDTYGDKNTGGETFTLGDLLKPKKKDEK